MLPIVIILIISAIVVTSMNLISIIITIHWNEHRKGSHVPLLSLLLAHTVQGLIVIPSYAAERSGLYESRTLCDIFRFSYLFVNYICCLSVLIISIDRFIGVQFPFSYQVWMTRQRVTRLLWFIWIYVLLLCLIPFIPYDRQENCNYNPQKAWVITMLVAHTFIPFIIITFCYGVIFRKMTGIINRKHLPMAKIVALTSLGGVVNEKAKVKKQTNKSIITLLIVGAYILTYGPSLFYYLLITICPNSCFPPYYHDKYKSFDGSREKEITGFVIKMLTLSDGFFSPLIYCCSHASFGIGRQRVVKSVERKFAYTKQIFVSCLDYFTHTALSTTTSGVFESTGEVIRPTFLDAKQSHLTHSELEGSSGGLLSPDRSNGTDWNIIPLLKETSV